MKVNYSYKESDTCIEIQLKVDHRSAMVIKKFMDFYQKIRMVQLQRFKMQRFEGSKEYGIQMVLVRPRKRY